MEYNLASAQIGSEWKMRNGRKTVLTEIYENGNMQFSNGEASYDPKLKGRYTSHVESECDIVSPWTEKHEHNLKCWPTEYTKISSGLMRNTVRQNDRKYALGDVLILREWNPTQQWYSGRNCKCVVFSIYDVANWHPAMNGYVVMDLANVEMQPQEEAYHGD